MIIQKIFYGYFIYGIEIVEIIEIDFKHDEVLKFTLVQWEDLNMNW